MSNLDYLALYIGRAVLVVVYIFGIVAWCCAFYIAVKTVATDIRNWFKRLREKRLNK